jgi:hypothetical protein
MKLYLLVALFGAAGSSLKTLKSEVDKGERQIKF